MAAIWKGALSFGLVNIPVALHPAVRKSDRISFRQLDSEDLTPIRMQRINPGTGDVVPWERIVKGYEVSEGNFIIITPEDFQQAALPSSRTIDVLAFVPATEVDVRYCENAYYMVPAAEGNKAYALLREAVRESGMVGIGKITMRTNSQHLAAVHAVGSALVLGIIRYANEVIPEDEYSFPDSAELRPQEVKMAEQLIGNLSESFDPGQYQDDYRANLQQIIEAKAKDEVVTFAEQQEPPATQVIDLVARLKESLQQTKGSGSRAGTGARKGSGGTTAKRSRATKSTAKKGTAKQAARKAGARRGQRRSA